MEEGQPRHQRDQHRGSTQGTAAAPEHSHHFGVDFQKSRLFRKKIIRFVIGSSPNLRPWKADVGEESCHTFVDDERLQSQYEQPVPGTEVILKYPFKKFILIPEAPEGVAVDIAFPLLWRLRPQCGGRTRTLQLDK